MHVNSLVSRQIYSDLVYYESIKRERSDRGTGTPKIKTRLIDEKFASVMGECVIQM